LSKITIKDIAHKAGVSITSVSFAFNNPERLSEATVQRILEAAEELGYIPDPIARSMNTRRTGTLGILVPQPIFEIARNPFLAEFLEGVGEVCDTAGLSLMIVPPLEGSMRRAIVNAAVDGFLTLGLELFKATMVVLHQRGIPFVMVDSDPVEGIPVVNVDDEGGARAAMNYVLQCGHRDIAILGIRSDKAGHYQEYTGTLKRRVNGYLAALADYDLTVDDLHIRLVECPSTLKGGQQAFHQVWKDSPRPTALVAMSDIIAIGAIDAARRSHVQIPRDLSIVGFDDIPMASLITPRLTTVAQPLRRKGKLAAQILVKRLENDPSVPHHMLPTELMVRETVANLGQ
jgi:DNA-binding LacI/PurR family transcriptional regulator